MKDTLRTAAFVAALLLACGAVWAGAPASGGAEAPTPAEEAPAAPAAVEQKPVDLKAALTPEQYQRAVQPILTLLERGAKALALYDEEMAKPDKERDEATALGHKERAARFYLAASLRARLSRNYVSQETHKAALTDQYEVPMRIKAVTLYLEVAAAYLDRHDLRAAVACYQRVLNIDPQNAEAKQKMEQIAAAVEQAASDTGPIRRSSSKKEEESTNRDPKYYRERYNPDYYTPESYRDRYIHRN
ncbi:MAG: hypothetical protein WBD63_08795 [Phycisphaerae bacterium]|nr:hypothetical protein [Phycisphaerae bacterium]